MGVIERRTREKEVLRGQIIAAATELFVSEGYANVSMRRIADKIEYAPSTIYLYFKDKEELVTTIIQEVFFALTNDLREIHNSGAPTLDALRAGLELYIRFGIEHPHHYRLTFGPDLVKRADGQPTQADLAGLECFSELQQIVERGIAEGVIRPLDSATLSQTIWMFIHGTVDILICSTEMESFPWAPQEDIIRCSVDLTMRSISVSR